RCPCPRFAPRAGSGGSRRGGGAARPRGGTRGPRAGGPGPQGAPRGAPPPGGGGGWGGGRRGRGGRGAAGAPVRPVGGGGHASRASKQLTRSRQSALGVAGKTTRPSLAAATSSIGAPRRVQRGHDATKHGSRIARAFAGSKSARVSTARCR